MHEPPATSSLVISASPLPLPLLFSRFKKLLLFSSSLLLLLQKPLPAHSETLKELCPFHRACQALLTFIPAVNHTALFRVNLGGIIYVKNKAEKSTSKFPCRHLFFFFGSCTQACLYTSWGDSVKCCSSFCLLSWANKNSLSLSFKKKIKWKTTEWVNHYILTKDQRCCIFIFRT